MSDEAEIAQQRRKYIWIIAGISAAGVLILAGAVVFGLPAYRAFKESQSLNRARAALQEGDLRDGILSLRRALSVNPANVPATRMMAELLEQAQPAVAIGWWQRVVDLNPTTEHRVRLAAAAVRTEQPPFPLATATLNDLQRTGADTNAAYHLVASQHAMRLNRMASAVEHLEAAARLDPTNRLHRLNLATLQLRLVDATAAARARRELSALVADPTLGEHALRSLIADHLMDRRFNEAELLSGQLLALPAARFEDRLQHLTVLAAAGNTQTNACLAQLKAAAVTNAAEVAQIAGWLLGHGRAQEALDWLSPLDATIRSSPPLPLLEADCHLALKDWSGLEQFLVGQDWEELEAVRLALLARALREQGRREVADLHWRRALDVPGGRGELLGHLSRLAATWGWQEQSEEALWALVRRVPRQDWAWQSLIRTRREAGDTAGLYRIYSAMLEKQPEILLLKNNVAATGLLLNRDKTKCTQLAREVYLAATTNATFVSTHAFAMHLEGRTAEGLTLMQALPETELRQPGVATYYAILLAARGRHAEAAPFLAIAEKNRPLPEEERLLAAARPAD